MLTTRCTSSRGPHAGCAGRADNVTGMLGVDLGSQSVVGRVNAVTDLSGKDVSARRARCCLVFAAGGSGLLPESHPSPLTRCRPAQRDLLSGHAVCAHGGDRGAGRARDAVGRVSGPVACARLCYLCSVCRACSAGIQQRQRSRPALARPQAHLQRGVAPGQLHVGAPFQLCLCAKCHASEGMSGSFMHAAPADLSMGYWTSLEMCVSLTKNSQGRIQRETCVAHLLAVSPQVNLKERERFIISPFTVSPARHPCSSAREACRVHWDVCMHQGEQLPALGEGGTRMGTIRPPSRARRARAGAGRDERGGADAGVRGLRGGAGHRLQPALRVPVGRQGARSLRVQGLVRVQGGAAAGLSPPRPLVLRHAAAACLSRGQVGGCSQARASLAAAWGPLERATLASAKHYPTLNLTLTRAGGGDAGDRLQPHGAPGQ